MLSAFPPNPSNPLTSQAKRAIGYDAGARVVQAQSETPPLAQALDHADQGIALTDAQGRARWCNSVFTESYLHADEPDLWHGRCWKQLFRPLVPREADWARMQEAIDRLRHTPKGRIEVEDLRLDWGGGPLRHVDLVLSDLGTPEAGADALSWVAWYFYDVTAHRKVEENLEALLKHSSDGIFMIDADCRMRLFNEACERITGLRAVDVLHRDVSLTRIFPGLTECPRTRQAAECMVGPRCFAHGTAPERQETQVETRDGRVAWVEINYAPVLDEHGQMAYMLGIVRDVTRRRELEDQLRLSRKLATLGELASAVAHEIKNPLGIILSAAEIIMNPARPAEQKQQAAEFIRDEAKRLDERLATFLNFSRPKPPSFVVQSIHRTLTQTMIAYSTLAREGLEIHNCFASNLPRVSIDADQMQQVFLNLLLNADQAMPAGGTITIATRRDGPDRVEIEIGDEGLGLPEGDPERLFEPFFSTKPRGTGLGLAIVMQIVSSHGGTIIARNRPQGGAAFVVSLPCAPAPPPYSSAIHPLADGALASVDPRWGLPASEAFGTSQPGRTKKG